MKMMVVLIALAAGGCATAPPTDLAVTFDPSEVAWAKGEGANRISGNAVLRTVGGEARTCAGLDAWLVPVSTYANARMSAMFGSLQRGYLAADSGFQFKSTDPSYVAAAKNRKCDAQGNFTFGQVPDGDYFVTAEVTWSAPGQYGLSSQGGVLMERVSVKGGESKELVLTAG